MTTVFFYYDASDALAAACALVKGVWKKRNPLLIYAPDPNLANSLDRALWSTEAASFIPHCRADSPLAAETPILIAAQLDQVAQTERLMNLSRDIPPAYQRFTTLVEVVSRAEDDRLAARARVQHYRADNCAIQFFDLSQR
ncbi:DNA polymerase III subunit chi [Azonexus sp.]|uniref:DNA polymerase III subunit chi n=1 Tax=Azonexus sp. TaxID=1872668 RepID=UPI0039E2A1ED